MKISIQEKIKRLSLQEKTKLCFDTATEKEAYDITILDVKDTHNLWEFIFICSADSLEHLTSIKEDILENLKKKGVLKKLIQENNNGKWILIDFDDLIVHIFHKDIRHLLEIEKLSNCTNEIKKITYRYNDN